MIQRKGPRGQGLDIPSITPPGGNTQGGGWNPPSYIEQGGQGGKPVFTPPQEATGDKRDVATKPVGKLPSAAPGATEPSQGGQEKPVDSGSTQGAPQLTPSLPPPEGSVTTTVTPVLPPPGGALPPMVEPAETGIPIFTPPSKQGKSPRLDEGGDPIVEAGSLPGQGKTPGEVSGITPQLPPPVGGNEPSQVGPEPSLPLPPGVSVPQPIVEPPNPGGGVPGTTMPVEGGQGQDAAALFGDFGKLLKEALMKPSRYDAEEAKKFLDHGRKELEGQRDYDLSAADAEAASRGVFYGTPGTNMRMDAREKFSRGLGDLTTNIAREQATTAGQDRERAVSDVFNFLGQGREDDKMKVAIAQLIGSMGQQGELDFGNIFNSGGEAPDFGGGVDWGSLGALFGGGGQGKPPVVGKNPNPAPAAGKVSFPNPPVKGPPKLTSKDVRK